MFEIIEKYNFWDNQIIKTGFIRDFYLNKILPYIDNPLIKVLIGQRRVGKSYIMRMIIDKLIKRNINPKNILYINKDIFDLDFIKDGESLKQVISEYKTKLKIQGKIYIFIDEIQEIKEWEKIINSLSQDYIDQYDIYISGSNSNLLSKELSTYISGRYVLFEIFPFGYKEYLSFLHLENNKLSFIEYLKNGGMPETLYLSDYELKRNYINALKDSIILKDIIHRHNIRDSFLLEHLINFLIDSTGSFFSINKIVNYLSSNKIKTNNETIGNYTKFIEDTFLIHGIDKYDIKGKEILSSEKKYYLNDLSFKYFLTSSFDYNISRYLENIIFIHLKRNGYKLYIGKIKEKEIDFIAEKDKEKMYLQVCYILSDQSIIDREFGNLALIKDNYEKYIISMDDINFGNKEGIKHILAWDFLNK